MFNAIAKRYNVSLEGVPSVGDSLRDLQAGFLAGSKPMLVMTGKGLLTNENGGLPPGTILFDDLAAVADYLLNSGNENITGKNAKP
jgi:D-glycero-D-manno-heptose 1,7-bisphosphate phosphatase